ncbi:hypothetical protein C8A01DRAFT_34847 [Parachaetomium inaequale]|uniref:F-box domain-containing protein n=1 Tax=Parachaetomium inaequale TaxID=2588326 RepID=A0AAN6PL55_9PEZI|nr:hypothetical protein C8A01DRAFT_34847 [Parachaetomium inaequale]
MPEERELTPASQANAPLENLPAEIRRQILFSCGLDELRTLVRASPVFHQQYLLDRKSILCSCLDATLGSTTVEACALYRFEILVELLQHAPERPEAIARFRHTYDARFSPALYSALADQLTETEAISIVAEYSSLIRPIAQQYAGWALENLSKETQREQHQCEPLSRVEQTRIARALYRFQLCCRMFGSRDDADVWRLGWVQPGEFNTTKFIHTMEPWEIEQFASVYTFVRAKYEQVFDDIQWDLNPDHPRFQDQQRPPTPDGAFELEGYWRDPLRTGTLSKGLRLLHTLLFKITNQEHLVTTMQANICYPKSMRLEDDVFGTTRQLYMHRERVLGWGRKTGRPLPFRGDGGPDAEGDRPPLAWTLMWRETYSCLFGECLPDTTRHCGYVMWDAARIEGTGADEVLSGLAAELSLDIDDYT